MPPTSVRRCAAVLPHGCWRLDLPASKAVTGAVAARPDLSVLYGVTMSAPRGPHDAEDADDDPVEETLEEAALARARAHLAELDAEARLAEEAAAADPATAAAAVTPQAVAPRKAQTREEADAEALAEFQKLRERSSKKTL